MPGSINLKSLYLGGKRPLDDVLAHVVLLRQHEKLPDLGRPLRSKPAGLGVVGQAGNLLKILKYKVQTHCFSGGKVKHCSLWLCLLPIPPSLL